MPGILPNQFLFPPQKRSANSNCRKHIFTVRTDQLLSLKLDQLTFFNCSSLNLKQCKCQTAGTRQREETPGLRDVYTKCPPCYLEPCCV